MSISPPSAQQTLRSALAGQVDRLTQKSVAASEAVVATGKVLDLIEKSSLA
jgi:hypothetical protein